MNKLLFASLSVALLLGSCTGHTSGNSETSGVTNSSTSVNPKKALKPFFDDFIRNNPDYLNNSLTKEAAAELLAKEFTALASSDSLACIADLPAKFEMMLPYPGGKEYVVKFVCLGMRSDVSDEYEVAYQAFGKLPKEEAAKIKENVAYSLSGAFVGFLTPSTFVLPSGRGATDLPSIYNYGGEKPTFNLGTLVIDGLTFTEAGQ